MYTDASLSNPEVSNFLMDPKKLQGDLEIWERNEREKEGVVGEVKEEAERKEEVQAERCQLEAPPHQPERMDKQKSSNRGHDGNRAA